MVRERTPTLSETTLEPREKGWENIERFILHEQHLSPCHPASYVFSFTKRRHGSTLGKNTMSYNGYVSILCIRCFRALAISFSPILWAYGGYANYFDNVRKDCGTLEVATLCSKGYPVFFCLPSTASQIVYTVMIASCLALFSEKI